MLCLLFVRCNKFVHLSGLSLPEIAVELGFKMTPLTYESFGEYSVEPGPKDRDPEMTALGALTLLMTDDLIKHFQKRAAAYARLNNIDMDYSQDGVWRYVAAVLAHGVVQYSTEEDAYRAAKSSLSGLLSNDFLRKLHTHEAWKRAKQAFAGEKEVMTHVFNRQSKAIWKPTKYAQLHITSISYLFFCFLRFNIVSENRALMKEAYQPWPTCWRGNTPHLSHIQMLWSTLLQLEVTCSALISCGHMTHAPSMVRLRNASTDRCIHQVFSGSAFPRPPASYILYRCTLGLPCTYGTYI